MQEVSALPKFAIVVPVYRTEAYLMECLESIRTQTYRLFKVFVVDDGSPDNCGKIIDQYSEKDDRFIAIHKTNGGVSSARNVALELIESRGNFDLITFCDADDLMPSTALEVLRDLYVKYGVEYIVGATVTFDKRGSTPPQHSNFSPKFYEINNRGAFDHLVGGGFWSNKISRTQTFSLSNRCFSAELLKGIRFDEQLVMSEDQDYLLNVLKRVKKGLIHDIELTLYRARASSAGHNKFGLCREIFFINKELECISDFEEGLRLSMLNFLTMKWWKKLILAINENYIDRFDDEFRVAAKKIANSPYAGNLPFRLRKRILFFNFNRFLYVKYLHWSLKKRKHADCVSDDWSKFLYD